jgi:hypothetical protein
MGSTMGRDNSVALLHALAGAAVGDPPDKTGDVPRLVAFSSLLVTHIPPDAAGFLFCWNWTLMT